MNELYILRLWDYHDGWIDVTGQLDSVAINIVFNERTNNGTYQAKENYHGNYYKIFPAQTQMLITPESQGR